MCLSVCVWVFVPSVVCVSVCSVSECVCVYVVCVGLFV